MCLPAGEGFAAAAATIFSVTRQKIWKKSEPKRDAFAPLFGNTQQTGVYLRRGNRMASATVPAPQGAGTDVVVGRDNPGAPLSEITTASAPERKRGGADVEAKTAR